MSTPSGPLCTQDSVTTDLRALIPPGTTILLHSSLRSLGYVVGGAETVVGAFLDVLTPDGTLVVPTHTGENSDPKNWESPPVPEQWWSSIREHTPAFDARTARTRGMGSVPEMVRTWPGALRSAHPQTSFAAIGGDSERIVRVHNLDCMLGEQSPLAALEQGAKVVLLGVGFDVCTVLHLAEYRVSHAIRKTGQNSFAAFVDGNRQWVTVHDIEPNNDDFEELGKDFEAAGHVTKGRVGGADVRVFDVKEIVAFAKDWFERNRS